MENSFHFDFEADVFEKAKADGGTGRYIGGFVTTDHKDREKETVIQAGLDFNPFLEKGFFSITFDSGFVEFHVDFRSEVSCARDYTI